MDEIIKGAIAEVESENLYNFKHEVKIQIQTIIALQNKIAMLQKQLEDEKARLHKMECPVLNAKDLF